MTLCLYYLTKTPRVVLRMCYQSIVEHNCIHRVAGDYFCFIFSGGIPVCVEGRNMDSVKSPLARINYGFDIEPSTTANTLQVIGVIYK